MWVKDLEQIAEAFQEWFDSVRPEGHAADQLQVAVVATVGMQAIEVDQVTIWCSEHDYPDEENGEEFGLEYLQRRWYQHIDRLIGLTPLISITELPPVIPTGKRYVVAYIDAVTGGIPAYLAPDIPDRYEDQLTADIFQARSFDTYLTAINAALLRPHISREITRYSAQLVLTDAVPDPIQTEHFVIKYPNPPELLGTDHYLSAETAVDRTHRVTPDRELAWCFITRAEADGQLQMHAFFDSTRLIEGIVMRVRADGQIFPAL